MDAVAINIAIVGLRAGQFCSHLMREMPKTIQHLYKEFEKYCHFDNDFRMCIEEQSQQKKFAKVDQSNERERANPKNVPHQHHPRSVYGLEGDLVKKVAILRCSSPIK
jgi:hypothetical protein